MLGQAVPLNLSTKLSQIGIRCSGTRKCSQRYEIDHFCPGFFPAIQSCEIPFEIPFGILVKFSFGIHLEILFDIPFEVPCGLPLELSLEISLEIPFEIPLQTPLELFLEIQFEIPFEIHFYIPFEKHNSQKPSPPTSLSSFSLVL